MNIDAALRPMSDAIAAFARTRGAEICGPISWSDSKVDYAADIYAGWTAHEPSSPSTDATIRASAAGFAKQSYAMVTTFGTMHVGPEVSAVLQRHANGERISTEDAAMAVRLIGHELTHVTAPLQQRAYNDSSIAEGLAEANATTPAYAAQVARTLGFEPSPDLLDRACGPLGRAMGRDGRATYDDLRDAVRTVMRLAGENPDDPAVVAVAASTPIPEFRAGLVERMLQANSIQPSTDATQTLDRAVSNWFGSRANTHPAAVLATLYADGHAGTANTRPRAAGDAPTLP